MVSQQFVSRDFLVGRILAPYDVVKICFNHCCCVSLLCIVVSYFQDLFSVMIKGPERTPYEDGLFFFDMQLPPDYPKVRTLFCISYML